VECRDVNTDRISKLIERPTWFYYCPSDFSRQIPSYSYPEIEQTTCVQRSQRVNATPNAQPVANTCSTDTPITLTSAVKKFTEADYRSAFPLFRFERYYRSTGRTDDPSVYLVNAPLVAPFTTSDGYNNWSHNFSQTITWIDDGDLSNGSHFVRALRNDGQVVVLS